MSREVVIRRIVEQEIQGQSLMEARRLNRQQILDALRARNFAGHSLRSSEICLLNRALAITAQGLFGD